MKSFTKLGRRQFLYAASAAALTATRSATVTSAIVTSARADDYPSHPVRLVVGFPPGQSADISARLLGQFLSDRLGQPFVIDNRPGASNTVATDLVAHAPPDGYTLLWISTSNYINATLYPTLPYDFIRDIEPIAANTRGPLIMEVNPDLPVKTVPDFIAYCKASLGKVNMASGGIGNSTHMAGALFNMMTGADMIHVPYRGSAPALTDLMAGRVQVMFDLMPSSIGYIRGGKLRPLAVTTLARSEALPGIPAIADFVPGYEASAVGGFGAPKGTPREIVTKLNIAINAALADPAIKSRLADLGGTPLPGSPDDFKKLIAAETAKWAGVIRAENIKPE